MFDAFISHSSIDKGFVVNDLVRYLHEKHLSVWLDQDYILAGDAILTSIEQGISKAHSVVLIVTKNMFSSFWVPVEVGLSLRSSNLRLIPVLYDVSTELVAQKFPYLLTQKYIQFSDEDKLSGFQKIASAIIEIRQRADTLFRLDIEDITKKLYKFNTPSANRLSILMSEYESIAKISVGTSIAHMSRIASCIISDIYSDFTNSVDHSLTIQTMLTYIAERAGVSKNILAHLEALLRISNSMVESPFINESDQQKMAELSLKAVLTWYITYIETNRESYCSEVELEVVDYDGLTYSDFIDMHQIDKLTLRKDLIAEPHITWKWYEYNHFTHIAIRSRASRRIVGYAAVLPITDDLFYEIQSGKFKDNDLGIDNIRRYDMPDFYKLYAACINVHPEYQNTSAFYKLYNALIKTMYFLATEREVYITEVIAEASTLHGKKLCKLFGLQKSQDTELDTELYKVSLLPPSLRLRSNFGIKLLKFYQQKYIEFEDLL